MPREKHVSDRFGEGGMPWIPHTSAIFGYFMLLGDGDVQARSGSCVVENMKSILSSILRIKYYHSNFKVMIVDPRSEMRRNTSAVLNRKADENLENGTLARRNMKTAQLNDRNQTAKQTRNKKAKRTKLQNTQCEDNKKAIRKGQREDVLRALGSQTHA